MSPSAAHGTSASKSSVSSPVLSPLSPLSQVPKFSPPSSRNTSPIRRPLHDRSNSQTNQYVGPTIRIVDDPGTDIYSKTPFPSQPSHILPARTRPGYVFEGRGSRVSDRTQVANAVAKIEAGKTLVPKPSQQKKASRHSTSTSISDSDTVVASSFSPSSSRFSQGSTPSSSIFPEERPLEILQEDTPLSPRPTIRAVIPSSPPTTSSSSGTDLPDRRALTPKASAASLASNISADTIVRQRSSSSGNCQPIPSGHQRTSSLESIERKQASSTTSTSRLPLSKPSTESFAYSETPSVTERPRSSSQPSSTIHDARQVSLSTGVRLHYPVVRAPSASSHRAESQNFPTITSRMNNRASQVHQWSSQLSTIASESERGSLSFERSSRSFDARSQSQEYHAYHDDDGGHYIQRRRQTVSTTSSSEHIRPASGTDSVVVPLPLFSPMSQQSYDDRDLTGERLDTVSPLQSPPLRNKRSFLRRHSSDSRSSSSRAGSSRPGSSRPGSAQSDVSAFVVHSLPAWAKVYYRRGERTSLGGLGAPDTSSESSESVRAPSAHSGRTATPSEGNFPLSIYRPRNRAHVRISQPESMSDGGIIEQEVYVIRPAPRPIMEPFTPRLRQDQRSQARLSAWKAPSLDESLGTMFFSRQNRQIVLFCLGFIFPFAWMLAACLPLPPDPTIPHEASPSQIDVERHFASQLGPVDDRSYQKAVWWRNLNRIMSAIGTLLIGVIIALSVLAVRMSRMS